MKCDAYRILINELEYGRLNDNEADLLRRHLDMCEGCRAYQEGRRAMADSRAECASLSDETPYPSGTASQSPRRSWGWAAVAVIGLAALVALVLMFGPGRWSHRGAGLRGAENVKHAVWRAP